MNRAETSQSRILEIDALRGVFAFAVLVFHYLYRYDSYIAPRPDNPFTAGTLNIYEAYLGLIPVYFFFIISGYVISMTLDRTAAAVDFAVGRATRLYPAYWVAILATSVSVILFPLPLLERSAGEIAVNLTMVQQLFRIPDVDGVYWSLYVELCFYVFVFLLHVTRLWQKLIPVLFAWATVALLYGLLDPAQNPIPTPLVDLLVLNYAHFFVAGIVFYLVGRAGRFQRNDLILLTICLAGAGLRYPIGISLAVAGAFGLFALIVTGKGRALARQPLLFLGAISYTLYLVHQHIGYVLIAYLDFPFWWETIIATTVAILLATAITYLIERPAQRFLRRKWRRYRQAKNSSIPV